MNYTFEINSIAVTPQGDWDFEYKRNAGQIFFRKVINGEFIFTGADYNTIMGMTDCDVLDFEIFCQEESVWEGEFKFPYDFDIDEDACILTGTPEVVDQYTCIMKYYDTKYWLLLVVGGIQPDLYDCTPAFLMNINNFGYTIHDYLNFLINSVSAMGCSYTLSSSFFWRDDFPNGDVYATYYGANNYVTGAANRLEYIYMWKNTAIRTVMGGSGCDGTDYFSFKDFEEMFRVFFNAYWYIDSNGDFRIEHISFFLNGFAHSDFGDSAIDLTSLLAPQTGKSFAYRRNKYSYLDDRLYDQEVWKMQHYEGTEGTIAHQNDFQGVPVFYGAAAGDKSDCVPGDFKELEHITPNFWTDIYWAYQLSVAGTANTIGCPGWLLMDIDTAPTPDRVRCENGAISGVARINGHLSIANLLEAYHTWNRIFLDGDMNTGNVVAFDSAIKKVLQEEITFPVCCNGDFDVLKGITTEMGVGEVYSAKQDQKSITVELLYD